MSNNSGRVSLLCATAGWLIGLVMFVLFQATIGPSRFEPRRTLLNIWPITCVCIAPVLWVAGAAFAATAISASRTDGRRGPFTAIAGLALSVIALAIDAFVVLALINPGGD